MVKIEIIAGPPGSAKITSGRLFVTEGIVILNHDLITYQYRKKGFVDAAAIANMKFNSEVKNHLLADEPFAVELNLGFQEHYEFVKYQAVQQRQSPD